MANNNEGNTISELRDALFNQLQRLQDTGNNLEKEVMRAKAMVDVGNVIVNSAKAEIDFARVTGRVSTEFIQSNKLIGDGSSD